MRGIKIPQQDFALKIQGGGVFAGHYGAYMVCNKNVVCQRPTTANKLLEISHWQVKGEHH